MALDKIFLSDYFYAISINIQPVGPVDYKRKPISYLLDKDRKQIAEICKNALVKMMIKLKAEIAEAT